LISSCTKRFRTVWYLHTTQHHVRTPAITPIATVRASNKCDPRQMIRRVELVWQPSQDSTADRGLHLLVAHQNHKATVINTTATSATRHLNVPINNSPNIRIADWCRHMRTQTHNSVRFTPTERKEYVLARCHPALICTIEFADTSKDYSLGRHVKSHRKRFSGEEHLDQSFAKQNLNHLPTRKSHGGQRRPIHAFTKVQSTDGWSFDKLRSRALPLSRWAADRRGECRCLA
jgi:hypothetical protein